VALYPCIPACYYRPCGWFLSNSKATLQLRNFYSTVIFSSTPAYRPIKAEEIAQGLFCEPIGLLAGRRRLWPDVYAAAGPGAALRNATAALLAAQRLGMKARSGLQSLTVRPQGQGVEHCPQGRQPFPTIPNAQASDLVCCRKPYTCGRSEARAKPSKNLDCSSRPTAK